MWQVFDLSRIDDVLGNGFRVISSSDKLHDALKIDEAVKNHKGVRHSNHREETKDGVTTELVHGILIPSGCTINTTAVLDEMLKQYEKEGRGYLKGMCHTMFDIEQAGSGEVFTCQLYRSQRQYIRVQATVAELPWWQKLGVALSGFFGNAAA